MYGLTILLLGVSLLSIVSGAPAGISPSNDGEIFARDFRVCETTTGSPFTSDVIDAGNLLNRRTFCCQDNIGGSYCSMLAVYETAAIGICGKPQYCIPCTELGELAKSIGQACQWRDPAVNRLKSGGQQKQLAHGYRLIVYHA